MMSNILGFDNIPNILLYIIILIICVLIVDLLIKLRFTSKFENVTCVPYLPIFGSVPLVFLFGIKGGLVKVTKKLKDSFLIWVFYKPVYCVTQPKEVQYILLNQHLLNKGTFYKYVDMMDNTLLVTDVNSWRNHRKMLNKCFNNQQLNSYCQVYSEFAELLGNDVSEEVTIKEFNEMAERRLISTFFGSVANFGPIGSHSEGFEDYIKFDLSSAMKSLTTTMMNRYLNPLYHSDFIFFNSQEGKNFLRLNKLIEEAVTDVIQKKKELQREQNNEEDGNHYFLDTIIQGYDSLENIKNEVKFFGGASALTNSPALSACFLMLGLHQDKQQKLYNEIVEVMGKEDTLASYHLPHLVYTDMVVNETLRLFSPVPFIMRQSMSDINTGKRVIPKGTDILIPIQNLHRDEDYWENPLEFRPERFLPEEIEKRTPGCYLPFSIGPRNCIGMKYSELVLKFYIVSLVKKFRISCDIKKTEDVKLSDAMFLTLPDDLKLRFTRRSQA